MENPDRRDFDHSPNEEEDEEEEGQSEEEETTSRKGCPSCGEALTFQQNDKGEVIGTCDTCGTSSTFVLFDPEAHTEPRMDRERAPSRGFRGGGFSGGRPQGGGRGCRQCGGPLEFSTRPDGSVTGRCTECGNRFTLPPREDRGGRGGGGYGRGGGGRSYGRGPREGGWGGGPPRSGGFRGPDRRGFGERREYGSDRPRFGGPSRFRKKPRRSHDE